MSAFPDCSDADAEVSAMSEDELKDLYYTMAVGIGTNYRHNVEIIQNLPKLTNDPHGRKECIDIRSRLNEMTLMNARAFGTLRKSMLKMCGVEFVKDMDAQAVKAAETNQKIYSARMAAAGHGNDDCDSTVPALVERGDDDGNSEADNEESAETEEKRKQTSTEQRIEEAMQRTAEVESIRCDGQFDREAFVNNISDSFVSDGITLGTCPLVAVTMDKVEDAIDSCDLRRIIGITQDFSLLLSNLEKYKRILDRAGRKNKEFVWDRSSSFGYVCSRLEESRSKKCHLVLSYDQNLQEATSRYLESIGEDPTTEVKHDTLMNWLGRGHALTNMLYNLMHFCMTITFDQLLSLAGLYLGHEERLEILENLWQKIRSNEQFNKEVKILEYKETVLLPALHRKDLLEGAIEVAVSMKLEMTLTQSEARRDKLLPVYKLGSEVTGGRELKRTLDYCAEKEKTEKRNVMTTFSFNALLKDVIEGLLPKGLLRHGFLRTALLEAPTGFNKKSCNFYYQSKKFFNKTGHDYESEIVKRILGKEMKGYDIEMKTVIVDNEDQMASLQRLLGPSRVTGDAAATSDHNEE